MSYLAASIADACAYTMFRMAGDALACRLRRRVLHCTMHRDLHELAQVRALHAWRCFCSLQHAA
jgi:ABC-type multidrug transport system fused ATPase/permease subunit